MAVNEDLADRIRAALVRAGSSWEERRMFGSRCFMVDGEILVCARGTGALLVRCAEGDRERLLQRPGAAVALMGRREMSGGWLDVAGDSVETDAVLDSWVAAALRRRQR